MKSVSDEILALYIAGEANEEQSKQVEIWLAENPAHQKELESLKKIWQERILYPQKQQFDSQAAFQRLNDRLEKEGLKPKKFFLQSKSWRFALPIAASITIILAIWGIFFNTNDNIHYEQEVTQQAQKSLITLEDGTKVWLNEQARLRYPEKFTQNTREVYLEGEAFFEVAHNPQKPFIVHTHKADVQVLGTSFLVKAENDQTETLVATGKVAIKPEKQTQAIILTPKQKAVVNVEKVQKQENVKLEEAIAWKKEVLLMKNETMEQIIEKLEKYYRVQIEVLEPTIFNCKLTGDFNNLDLEESLQIIRLALGIEYKLGKNKIELYGKGCPTAN
jgi:ferric-dicitrate binding protein FerR (iron transport regulator)